MLLPVAEIANVPRPANVGRPWLRCFHYGFIDADWEKDLPVFAALAFHCSVHFTLYPPALHRGVGQNDHDLVVDTNRLFNTFLEAVPNFQIFWSQPATHPGER